MGVDTRTPIDDRDYQVPFRFTGKLVKLTVELKPIKGTIAQIRKGDYAFLLPLELSSKGLSVSQFVLYKTIPFRQFNPAAK